MKKLRISYLNRRAKKDRKAGFWYKAWGRFQRNILSIVGFSIFLIFIFLGVTCPFLPIQDPMKQNWTDEIKPPSNVFWFGTDNLGRDIFSRVIWGARTSLIVGFESVVFMTIIGVILGSISGFYGEKVDTVIMRSTDIFLSFPRLLLLIVISSVLRIKSIYFTGFIIGITDWPAMTRVVRSNFLSIKEQTFVEAAKSIGAGNLSLIFKQILPNTLSSILVLATIRMGFSILTEAGLSFLGLGDPFIISWGQMLSVGSASLRVAPWQVIYPGIAVFFTSLGFNILGDGLRDAFDVRM